MEPRQQEVALLDADLGHHLHGGRALHHADGRPEHGGKEPGVGVAAQEIAPLVGDAVDDSCTGQAGRLDDPGHAGDGARLLEGAGQLGQRRAIPDHAPLHLGRHDRGVDGRDQVGEVDGHQMVRPPSMETMEPVM